MGDYPILLEQPEPILKRCDPNTSLYIGGIWGSIKAGQTVLASDGYRFVWCADNLTVIYSNKGKFYGQNSQGFVNEVRTAAATEAGRRAQFMAKVAEIEMKLLMGIVAGTGVAGFAIVVGVEIGGFVLENRENFAKWQKQLEAVLKARESLKKYAPTTYDKLFNAVLGQVYKDTKAKIPDSVTPEAVAFGIGVVIGSVGKKVITGKFTVLGLVFVIIQQLAVRFALNVVPEALKLTGEDYQKMAQEIIAKARNAGVTIHDLDAKKIVEEARQHPREIKEAYEILRGAFEELRTNAPK
jgi:hypothetical protein